MQLSKWAHFANQETQRYGECKQATVVEVNMCCARLYIRGTHLWYKCLESQAIGKNLEVKVAQGLQITDKAVSMIQAFAYWECFGGDKPQLTHIMQADMESYRNWLAVCQTCLRKILQVF